jgi:hypothetical protein
VGKRLEISVVGTYHIVNGVILTPTCVKAGIQGYGKSKWDTLIRDITLGLASKKIAKEVAHTVGDPLKRVFRLSGIDMQGLGFGFEPFWGGEFMPVDMVDAALENPKPDQFMGKACRGNLLAIFYARREGALSFRWDDVDDFNPGDICLHHVNGGHMLGGKGRLKVAVDVSYRGKSGKRKVAKAVTPTVGYGHVFHKAK